MINQAAQHQQIHNESHGYCIDEMSHHEDSKPPGRDDDTPSVGRESFPQILHAMIEEIEVQGLSHIVSWQPHGRCFVVHKRKTFVECIMPVYFRMSKFVSFQRQLNLYGFNRITKGQDKGGYFHELFLRGKKDLCKNIRRRQIKGTGTRKPDAPESEPNFYVMDFLPDQSAGEHKKLPPSTAPSSTAPSIGLRTSLTGAMVPSTPIPPHPSFEPSRSAVPWYPTVSTNNATFQPQHLESSSTLHMNWGPLVAALTAAGDTTPQGVMLRAALTSLTLHQPLTSAALVDAAAISLASSSPTNSHAHQSLPETGSFNSALGNASLLTTDFQGSNINMLHSAASLPHRIPSNHRQQGSHSALDAFVTALQSGIRDCNNNGITGDATISSRYSSSSNDST